MIEEKAKELGRLIGQSAEYQAVKRANDAITGDRDAIERRDECIGDHGPRARRAERRDGRTDDAHVGCRRADRG